MRSHPTCARIEPSPPAALPHRPRTLLVGTALTVGQMRYVLAGLEPAPDIVAAVTGDFTTLEATLGAHDVEQVLVSLPVARAADVRDIGTRCERAGVRWRFLPTLGDQLAGSLDVRGVTSGHTNIALGPAAPTLDLAALIDRTPRPLDEDAIAAYLAGRTVLITGAGGSIGSEIARIVSRFAPAKLVLVERSENALFEIDREIARRFPELSRAAELHDVTNAPSTATLVERHLPHVVFHAAAHKHVPMMEDHPSAAVENNLNGTRSIADAALAWGSERFVMISTDKAVNPSSVMGATKRLAELYVQHLNAAQRGAGQRTIFTMVRFGNVLGSACSVLPIWTEQLSRGGPITVTHPEMSRYFMTIPEAAGLVLQAGALSRGGEVFLLDMGRPIRIMDLAHRFLRVQGYEPSADIAVEFTGVRPGEKLHEELAYDGEDMLPTPHASVRIWKTTPPDAAQMQQITSTFDRLRNRDPRHPWAGVGRDAILLAIRAAVPEMVKAAAG